MTNKYKVKITSYDLPLKNLKNMVTKYQKEKKQGIMKSFGELIQDFKKNGNKRKKRKEKTKKKRRGGSRRKKRRKKRTRRRRRKKR
jgi:hypothetical protein